MEELFPCALPQHIYTIIFKRAKKWGSGCVCVERRARGKGVVVGGGKYYRSYFPAEEDFQGECCNPWVPHFIRGFRCNTVCEIPLSHRCAEDKRFPKTLGNMTVTGWQRLADPQNYYEFECLCPLRILLSKTGGESVGVNYSLCGFFIFPPYVSKLFLSNRRTFRLVKCFSKCTFYFVILPECTKLKMV